jgi:hypothetical protein
LQRRYELNKEKYSNKNISIISTYDYIKNNYKDKLLFYSMNHPTKYVIQYICEEIIKILGLTNTINYQIDILTNPKAILYQCIQKCVTFDIHTESPLTCEKINSKDITSFYYDTYQRIGFS